MSSLRGRTALVTGVGRRRGIGFAVARHLAERGADLLVHSFLDYDRAQPFVAELDPPETLVSELRGLGARVEHVEADFLDPLAPERVVSAAVDHFGRLDILVANHAYSTRQPLAALSFEEIDRHLLVNVRASLLLASAFARVHGGGAGRLVLLTSGQHLGPMGEELAYAASKGALHQITASLSDVLVDRGITVNAVNPGPTDTGWADAAAHEEALRRMPLKRWGLPEDAARLIGWLVSDDAAWVTGQVISSEGGFRRG